MAEMIRKAIWLIASFGLAFLFVCVSIFDVKRVSPAQFWPWQKVKPENLTDVAKYNQENCTMWMSCAFVFAVNGVIGLFNQNLSAVILLLLLFPGSIYLCLKYNRILRRYLKPKDPA